jgi:predicted phosphoadenosine phosphosulfate sulfurtransferase
MRVASAYIDEGVASLGLHRAIEPNTWAKLVGRVNGANFGAIYGATKAMGYKSISLPPGHTWKTYCEFLLSTLPPYIGKMFRKKFESTFRVWLKKEPQFFAPHSPIWSARATNLRFWAPTRKNLRESR